VFAFYDRPPLPGLTIRRAAIAGAEPVRRIEYLASAVAAAVRSGQVVLTRDLGVAAALVRLPAAFRPPLVYESHGFSPVVAADMPRLMSNGRTPSPRKLRRLHRREARVWRGADAYVTITRALDAELMERFGPRTGRAVVPDATRVDPDRRFILRRAGDRPSIAYAGNLYPWKGVDILLRALRHLPRVHATIVGGHPMEGDRQRLETLATSLEVEARVTFTGPVPRDAVPGVLASSDLLVIPHAATHISERYASPLKLFEYMAAGRPIVASDFPAIREVLQDGVNAVLVEPGDDRALACGIERVLQDPELAERIARTAFDHAEHYSWDRRAAALEDVLALAAGSRGAHQP
jgi:glycosyltransferase involved in cell wall biosynthesis